jgi:hypothetical protein
MISLYLKSIGNSNGDRQYDGKLQILIELKAIKLLFQLWKLRGALTSTSCRD